MAIPKTIHYVWIGREQHMPETIKECIQSWKVHCPDWEIKLWNEDNIPWESSQWLMQCRSAGTVGYVFASDWVRFWAIYTYGGIYLDGDYLVKKPLDSLLDNKVFFALEADGAVGTACFGAEKGNEIIKQLFDHYNTSLFYDGSNNMMGTNSIFLVSDLLSKMGVNIPRSKFEDNLQDPTITIYSYKMLYDRQCKEALGEHKGSVTWYRNISIFCPFKNDIAYVKKWIDSVFSRIGPLPIEVFMVDLGSTDGSAEIVQTYRDDRVIYRHIDNEYPLNIFNNIIIPQSTGNLLMWCNIRNMFEEYALSRIWQEHLDAPQFDGYQFGLHYWEYVFKKNVFKQKAHGKITRIPDLINLGRYLTEKGMKIKSINYTIYE